MYLNQYVVSEATDKLIHIIETKDGELITVRPFSWKDLGKLNAMSQFLSSKTTNDYRAPLAQPRPSFDHQRQLMVWILVEVKLAISSVGVFRSLLSLVPHLAYLAFVAINSRNEIIGLRFYNIIGRKGKHKLIAEPGVVLRDDYQNKGIGVRFIAIAQEMAAKDIYIMLGECFAWNSRQLHVNEIIGFKSIDTYRNELGEEVIITAWAAKA